MLAPPVGVVIANHDNSAYVASAIESVARQSVRDIRVVVIDDASGDDSDRVIRDCLETLADERFRYRRLPSNVGQLGALRRGMAELDTPFICFVDSDDVWCEDFVARHLEVHLNGDFPVALTYCDSRIMDGTGRLLAGTAWWFDSDPSLPPQRPLASELLPSLDRSTGAIAYPATRTLTFSARWSPTGATNTTTSMMFRRDFLDLVFPPSDDGLRLYADFYLSTMASLLTGTIAIHDALYVYRMHGANKHSNAAVFGGAYNSSTKAWGPIRAAVLALVHEVLLDRSAAIRTAFGDQRYDYAVASVEAEMLNLASPPVPETALARWLDRLLALLGRRIGTSRPGRSFGSSR